MKVYISYKTVVDFVYSLATDADLCGRNVLLSALSAIHANSTDLTKDNRP